MGFFGKLKQMFGIGGVKIVCTTPAATFVRAGGVISGQAQLTSKTDQLITRLVAKVVEVVTTKEGDRTKEEVFDLGVTELGTDLALKAGESKTLDFNVAYTGGRSFTDKMKAKGGMIGAMGKIGALASGEKSEYRLRVEASVKGAMIGSRHHVKLKPV